MKANAGRFGFLHPDWAEPGQRPRGALALGVRRHLSRPARPELSVAAPTVRTTHGGENPC